MGKPYDVEISKLPETYKWAMSQDIGPLVKSFKTSAHLPLFAVGSGGSLTASELMAFCHQAYFGTMARSVTPLELLSALSPNSGVSVWFFSASGGNIDIKRAFEHALLLEPKHIAALTGCLRSPIAVLADKYKYSDLFEFDLPAGRDGFLATNSLLAFCVLMCRAYSEAVNLSRKLPLSYETLLSKALKIKLSEIEKTSHSLWSRPTLHILYSNELKAAAIDIESKFVEAGLGSVHLSDFRNFAHGRHHWFAKHGDTSALLALSVPSDNVLARKTLELLPAEIPKICLSIRTGGVVAQIASIIISLHLAKYAGRAKGIDPGRPGVPEFGTKIYNLKTSSGFLKSMNLIEAAIQRKVGLNVDSLSLDRKKKWYSSYNSFKKKLLKARFGGVIMDYDGTVVDSRNRFEPPSPEMSEQIIRLLENGIVIGFATGRGKSIRNDLKKVIPENLWDQVLVGYYNGAEIALLTDDQAPDGSSPPCDDLKGLFNRLIKNIGIKSLANIQPRKFQLTVEPTKIVPENYLWELAQGELCAEENSFMNVYRSSHSIDILARGVSKVSVISEVTKRIAINADILAIGDRGKWPGNDSRLLNHLYSLSVDEVSYSSDTCWNLCPAGIRGPQGTLYYLRSLLPIQHYRFKAVKIKTPED